MKEKREYSRKKEEFDIQCIGDKHSQYTEGRNISKKGLFMQTEKVEGIGSVVKLAFLYDGGIHDPILPDGKVIWSAQRPFKDSKNKTISAGMGIEFTALLSP